ncbi:MAG: SDR family NAD(P)-dependent oxidoreductase [candidate division Zixibacteria bacterium]|nr:SDR family NAD(P)-dependent oxidoreductase [candidate division Zixibacteria bacterium]
MNSRTFTSTDGAPRIAIVGAACRYPGSKNPGEMWENVLAGRREFRPIPPERLRVSDYLPRNEHDSDSLYLTQAAVIEGYEFDRVRFRIAGETYRSTDLTHWLALDVASQALEDAGFKDASRLPGEATGVVVGNSLTGEFSRASVMRLRWPFVRRTVDSSLAERGWSENDRDEYLAELEQRYKKPFPKVGDETLAGGLSNTIAGRICNYFNFGGGGFTIDGACSSSLLSVANACTALREGDIEFVLAGGVDLSLDPFELVGFSRVGALAREEMRVYDLHSTGFLPGEGCGFVLLTTYERALAQGLRIYAIIRGWGISSDGSGGLTRPELSGQKLALDRAYRRAGYGIETVSYFEGHGTGTEIGDQVELSALVSARLENGSSARPAAVGSIKANFGHTKAAAGVAGLLKATQALTHQIIPAATGFETPHNVIRENPKALRISDESEIWDSGQPLRAGVSSMGFGGINVHITLENPTAERRKKLLSSERRLQSSRQDVEIFFFSAKSEDDLKTSVQKVRAIAKSISSSEMIDLSANLASNLSVNKFRAAVIARTPLELIEKLALLSESLENETRHNINSADGVFIGTGANSPRILFLFTGQGSPSNISGGAIKKRFESARNSYEAANLPDVDDTVATAIAQPAIVAASLATLSVLQNVGIKGDIGIGHSLGELTAYHWANVMDRAAVLELARVRGKAMTEFSTHDSAGSTGYGTDPVGAMASIAAPANVVEELLKNYAQNNRVVIAGYNTPEQTVISGEVAEVEAVIGAAGARGLKVSRLTVSHAFHSHLVAPAAKPFSNYLKDKRFNQPDKEIISTITGSHLSGETDTKQLLVDQITSPVRFLQAVREVANDVDLAIEVGPGMILGRLFGECSDKPVISVDAGSDSLEGLLKSIGAAFALGARIDAKKLFADRFTRSFDINRKPLFFSNPCESAPLPENDRPSKIVFEDKVNENSVNQDTSPGSESENSALEIVRALVARRSELPLSSVSPDSRLLDDMHLNSIAVGQLVADASRKLGLPPPASPTDYSDATIKEIAEALESLLESGGEAQATSDESLPDGMAPWIRAFKIENIATTRTQPAKVGRPGQWTVFATHENSLVEKLRAELPKCADGDGVLSFAPTDRSDESISALLSSARAALQQSPGSHFALVQTAGQEVSSLARTLYLEARDIKTTIITLPRSSSPPSETLDWIIGEINSTVRFSECSYTEDGQRTERFLRLCAENYLANVTSPDTFPPNPRLNADDTLLVTGGGKGIAAECAYSLAKSCGVKLAILGRSDQDNDSELSINLNRFRETGVEVFYVRADVTDSEAVGKALRTAQKKLGTISAILYGAGLNQPRLIKSLDDESCIATIRTKVSGLKNVLRALETSKLKALVTFGSIIAESGLRGEADYAIANEWMAHEVDSFKKRHPDIFCVNLEWSVWSGVGMGERLGRIDALSRQGITPITPDQGVAILNNIMKNGMNSAMKSAIEATSIIISGRFGEPETLRFRKLTLPLKRFLENPRVDYPEIELVADSKLSVANDPYLNDHIYRGERLFPAVMGLEAMAQIATAQTDLTNHKRRRLVRFENIEFSRPIVAPSQGETTIRIVALNQSNNRMSLAVRCEDTQFHMNHFSATAVFADSKTIHIEKSPALDEITEEDIVSLDVEKHIYRDLLFHGRRFQRLIRYRKLQAREILAEIRPRDNLEDWFGSYLPHELTLGDPAARDTAIHSIQACVPHASLLPIGVKEIVFSNNYIEKARKHSDVYFVHAREISNNGETYTYDMEILSGSGEILERWRELKLQVVAGSSLPVPTNPALLGVYLERKLESLAPNSGMEVSLQWNNGDLIENKRAKALRALSLTEKDIKHRPDGKPLIAAGKNISISHSCNLTMALTGRGAVACDIEAIDQRNDSSWCDLLGSDGFKLAQLVAAETKSDVSTASTRIWSVQEAIKKAGLQSTIRPTFVSVDKNWVIFKHGTYKIASLTVDLESDCLPVSIALLCEEDNK